MKYDFIPIYSFSSPSLYILLKKSRNTRQRVHRRVFLYTMWTLPRPTIRFARNVWENGGLLNKTWSMASCVIPCREIWAYWDFEMTSIKWNTRRNRLSQISMNPIHFLEPYLDWTPMNMLHLNMFVSFYICLSESTQRWFRLCPNFIW